MLRRFTLAASKYRAPTSLRAYLVGPRHGHYAAHSGYESVAPYCGRHLKSLFKFRWLSGKFGSQIDKTVSALTPRPWYPLGIFLIELTTALHMLFHRNSLYHVLYGDSDVWLLCRASRITGNRLIATFHEPTQVLDWYRIDQIAPRLDAVILVSESQRKYFEKLLPDNRIIMVPHGIDTEFFRPAEHLPLDPVCITVGGNHRDFDTLKSAITLVRKANPTARFMAVGVQPSGGHKPQLHDERVCFLDGLTDEELRNAYQTARVAVFPFRDATANNALLEAMACGLPIVATDVGGVREYLGEEAGILCKPRDPESLATGILKVIDDLPLARHMSCSARTRALAYDFHAVARRMRQVYSQIHRSGSR